jgi:hypothetical protein
MKKATMSLESLQRLAEIQEQMRELCEPHYDEYHRVTTEHGFTKITIPQQKRRCG